MHILIGIVSTCQQVCFICVHDFDKTQVAILFFLSGECIIPNSHASRVNKIITSFVA